MYNFMNSEIFHGLWVKYLVMHILKNKTEGNMLNKKKKNTLLKHH